jgi:hypothetical protein
MAKEEQKRQPSPATGQAEPFAARVVKETDRAFIFGPGVKRYIVQGQGPPYLPSYIAAKSAAEAIELYRTTSGLRFFPHILTTAQELED